MQIIQIDKIKFSKLDKDTRELIKEFHSAIHANYSCYNAALLLFRPILIHFCYFLTDDDLEINNFQEALDYLKEELNLEENYYELLIKLKNVSNEINHNCKVLYSEDKDMIDKTWDFIKWMVENILIIN